jgi:hypothetical protein
LQLHQPPQRLQCPPRLRAERQAGAEGLISNGPVAMGISQLQCKPGVGNLAGCHANYHRHYYANGASTIQEQ